MKKSIAVDEQKCIHCGMCIKDCIVNCLEFDENKFPKYAKDGEKICVGCQHCMAICPKGALSFGGKNPENSESINFCKSEDLLNLIKSRRSFRSFQEKDVPQEKITKLIEMLAYPPKGGNIDDLYFSIVGTAKKMREIEKFTYDKIFSMQTDSRIINICKETYKNGNDLIFRGASSMIAVSVDNTKAIAGCENADPIIALSYFELYAQSLGLGTVWSDATLTVFQEIPEVRAFLEIPENFTLNYIILFGIPKIKYSRTVQRELSNVKII